MSSKRDNTAKNLPVDQDAIDKGWEVEDKPEAGLDKFVFVEPERVRESIRQKVEKATRPEISVMAEDTVEDALAGLRNVLKRGNIQQPPYLMATGGEQDSRDFGFAFDINGIENTLDEEKQKLNAYAVTDDSDHKFNKGGVLMNFDDKTSELSFFLSQAEQYDQLAASRANAGIIKAGYEISADADVSSEELVNKAARNVEEVEEEFGEEHKAMDLTAGKLIPTTEKNSYKLELSNLGNNRCIIVNADSGKVRIVKLTEKEQQIEVKTNDLVLMANDELFTAFESKKEPAEMQIGNKLFMEHQMGKPLKNIMDELIEEIHGKGYDSSMSAILLRVPSKPELTF